MLVHELIVEMQKLFNSEKEEQLTNLTTMETDIKDYDNCLTGYISQTITITLKRKAGDQNAKYTLQGHNLPC